MPKFLEVTDKAAAKAAINADFFVNAKDFGVVGDGIADDTDDLQDWVDHVVGNHLKGFLPNGTYKITDTLVVPFSYGWSIQGENSQLTVISQATNNIPVVQIGEPPNASHSYSFESLTLTYASAQPSTNTDAINLFFDGTMGDTTTFFARFRDLRFIKGFYAMKAITGTFHPWGCDFDQLTMNDMSGGFLDCTGNFAAPNNRWGRISLFCNDNHPSDETGAIGPIFKNWNETSASIGSIEFLEAHGGATLIDAAAGFQADIGSIKLENGTYTEAGKPLFKFSGSHYVRIGDLRTCGNNLTISGGHKLITAGIGLGDTASYCEISTIRAEASSLTGDCYVVDKPGDPPLGRMSIGSVSINDGWQFIDTGATATANVVRVESWLNGAIHEVGDANYTVVPGSPNVLRFSTPFTAARTITLPWNFSTNLFNGLWYDFIFDGALGSHGATITQAVGGGPLTTLSAGKVKLRYTWKRFAWVLTEYTFLDGALGTPPSGTLTNCGGLPVIGIEASTSAALGVGTVELGHASDTTIKRVSAGVIAVEDNTVSTRLTNTATLDFGSIDPAVQVYADLTITVTGAATGDAVALGTPTAAITAGIAYTAWVSAADTVTVRAHNYTAGALDPASGVFRATIIR